MMNNPRLVSAAMVALAVLAGCNTIPAKNATLDQAHRDYRAAQSDPQVVEYAGGDLKFAADAMSKADEAWAYDDDRAKVEHLAYLAKQRVAIAQETASRKRSEQAVANATTARDEVRLAARTSEADSAQRSAQVAQRRSESSQLASDESRRQSEASQQQAQSSQRQADAAMRQASDVQARNNQLEAQLQDLNAKKTERGFVITIGDLLFDTNSSQLKSGGLRNVEKVVEFLKQYPQRAALIEGFTDNVGSDNSNQALSARRADSVRSALVDLGVGSGRITTRGYGEMYPVATNDRADGRQLNRRVEIILSDDNGNIVAR